MRRAFATLCLAVPCLSVVGIATAAPSTAALSSAAALAATPSADPPGWQVTTGGKIPTPITATAIRGRMPSFREPNVTYLLVFVNFREPPSRQIIPELGRIQTEHGAKVAVVAITDEPPANTKAFVEDPTWSGLLGFTVAADPGRSAFRTFFGPQSAPTLPQAFIMRDGVVQWVGVPMGLSQPVTEIVRGTWDLKAAQRQAEQQRLWQRALEGVEAKAAAKDYNGALTALDEACQSAIGDQQVQCLAARFSILLRADRVPEAVATGERIVAAPANPKQPAGLAWTLLTMAPQDPAARAFALKAAQQSDTLMRSRDAMVCAILARAQYMNGQRTAAVDTAKRALTLADNPDLTAALKQDLRHYEAGDLPALPPTQK